MGLGFGFGFGLRLGLGLGFGLARRGAPRYCSARRGAATLSPRLPHSRSCPTKEPYRT